MEWKPALQGTYGPNMNAFWWVAVEIWIFEKLAYKTLSQCDGNAGADMDMDDQGDCNSSPCTSNRWAKNDRTKNNREKVATSFFPIISQWGLSVVMETRALIQSAPKPYTAIPHPSDATHKIWSRLANWLQSYWRLKCGRRRTIGILISPPCEPSAQVSYKQNKA